MNVEFVVGDVETSEYTAFGPDLITAHLCMSDAIVERAARALAPGRVFAFVAFHTDQWRETGRPSRFAYDEARARRALTAAGFAVEHLEVEQEVSGSPASRKRWPPRSGWRSGGSRTGAGFTTCASSRREGARSPGAT